MAFDDKNQYLLRDGMKYVVNGRVFIGPEMLTLSLEDAFTIVHKLEGAGEIRAQYRKKNHDKLRKQQVAKRIAAYRRAGATKEEATEKAHAAILRQDERAALKEKEAAGAVEAEADAAEPVTANPGDGDGGSD